MELFGKGFYSFTGDENEFDLEVSGAIPAWLRGTYLRNGPGKFEVSKQALNHWFDGYALLNKLHFHERGIKYQSRFIQSEAFKSAEATGELQFSEFATNRKISFKNIFKPAFTDNTNVNLTKIGGKIVALTETPHQNEIDLETLETLGRLHYQDKLKFHLTSAHPHFDVNRQELFNYAIQFSRRSNYLLYRTSRDLLERKLLAAIPVDKPGYMHTFAITEHYCILIECPLLLNPLKLFLSGTPWGKPFIENYQWEQNRGTRFIVIDKNNGEVKAEFYTESFFMYHTINAYEVGREIVIDLSAYPNSSDIQCFYLDKIRSAEPRLPLARYKRFILSLKDKKITSTEIMQSAIEFPRIHYQHCNMKKHRMVYGASASNAQNGILDQLIKIDTLQNSEKVWIEPYCYPGEPIFIPAANTENEEDGVVLSLILNAQKDQSFLLILNAASFQEIARAELPHVLPLGLHGQFYR